MKIYKFRGLIEELDFYRLKEIIETGNFWCSTFWEMNDPVEGVFKISKELVEKISEVYGEKGQYKICSFSGKKGFKNPTLWGYYGNGFKGVAIEIEVSDCDVKKIKYTDSVVIFSDSQNVNEEVERILLNKNKAWKKEDEYRYLEKQKDNYIKIGRITAVYFGAPYDCLENSSQVKNDRRLFVDYNNFKEKIIKVAKEKNIQCFNVEIKDGKVGRGQKL